MTVLTRTLAKSGLKNVVGLCHEFLGVSDWLRRHFGRENFDGMEFVVTGINHFNWILKFEMDGQDAFPALHDHAREFLARKNRTDLNADPFADNRILKFTLFENFGYFPAAGDRHLAEFFPNVLTRENGYGGKYWIGLTSIQRRREDLARDRRRIQEMRDGKRELPKQKSGEKVADIMDALFNKKTGLFITNLSNTGQVENLPRQVVVEGLAEIQGKRMVPQSIGEIPSTIFPLIAPHVWRQEMIVEASFTGDWNLAVEALASDPMIQDLSSVRKMAGELRAAQKEFLPQF
jgi:alpha-galactosidase